MFLKIIVFSLITFVSSMSFSQDFKEKQTPAIPFRSLTSQNNA